MCAEIRLFSVLFIIGYSLFWVALFTPCVHSCVAISKIVTGGCRLTVLNPDSIFYDNNVTLVFTLVQRSIEDKPELISNFNNTVKHTFNTIVNDTYTFTFVLPRVSGVNAEDYYVKTDKCSSGVVRICPLVKPTTPSQSPKPEVTSVVSTLTTKQGLHSSAQTTQSSTVKPTTPSQSPKPEVTNVVSTLTTKQGLTSSAQITQSSTDKPSDTSSTTKSQPIYNEANTDSIDARVLNQSAANDGSQNVIIAVACVVSVVIIVIAVVIAVVCMKRKRRSMANVPLQDTPREDQVAQEEGYASIGGSECQYAVVNKPKKLSTLQEKQDSPVENKPMEIQSKPEKPSGAGELIYADLDKEALTAKPINSTPAGTVEYVGIDFARTVALPDANKQEE
ncbi:uncharacterized protein LOC127861120 isoform X2 [Dreissena polymorpha]|uniref:uncharacterized protein LOC127861120 isoform X2 n=1 Tax=Dreissena polymorpha TaxID=45954 RepID=UPI002264387B|nr:uncharacterized protein LOC127861120 isoform X2 [Dreissena polymorpha]